MLSNRSLSSSLCCNLRERFTGRCCILTQRACHAQHLSTVTQSYTLSRQRSVPTMKPCSPTYIVGTHAGTPARAMPCATHTQRQLASSPLTSHDHTGWKVNGTMGTSRRHEVVNTMQTQSSCYEMDQAGAHPHGYGMSKCPAGDQGWLRLLTSGAAVKATFGKGRCNCETNAPATCVKPAWAHGRHTAQARNRARGAVYRAPHTLRPVGGAGRGSWGARVNSPSAPGVFLGLPSNQRGK